MAGGCRSSDTKATSLGGHARSLGVSGNQLQSCDVHAALPVFDAVRLLRKSKAKSLDFQACTRKIQLLIGVAPGSCNGGLVELL